MTGALWLALALCAGNPLAPASFLAYTDITQDHRYVEWHREERREAERNNAAREAARLARDVVIPAGD